VKQFRTDGGGEYTSKKFAAYLKSDGFLKETTTPSTSQSNGVVKWVFRTIMERVQCMLDMPDFRRSTGPLQSQRGSMLRTAL
jgi:hypothetical protein